MRSIEPIKWEVKIVDIDIDEIAGNMNMSIRELKHLLGRHYNQSAKIYPTTICYEFYDENDDYLPDQPSYRKLLTFSLDTSMRKRIQNSTIDDIKRYKHDAEEMGPKIGEKIAETTNGAYTLLDFFVDYEKKGSYYVVYFQYKIKQNDPQFVRSDTSKE